MFSTYFTITHERDGKRVMLMQTDKKSPRLYEKRHTAASALGNYASQSRYWYNQLVDPKVERVDLMVVSDPEHLAVDNDPPLRDRTVKELADRG